MGEREREEREERERVASTGLEFGRAERKLKGTGSEMGDPYYGNEPKSEGGGGCGPLSWLKKKLSNLKSNKPELFSFVTGVTVGTIVIVGTALVKLSKAECSPLKMRAKKGPRVTVFVEEDQTLGDILVKYVGDYTEENLKEVQRLNKGKLKNLDLINVGLELVVPDNREIAEAPVKEVKAIEEVKTEVAPVVQKKKETAPVKKQQKQEPKSKSPQKEDSKKKAKKDKPAKAPKSTKPDKQDKKAKKEKPAKAGGFLFFGGKADASKKKKDAKLPQDKW